MPKRPAPQRRFRLDRGLLRRTVWAFGQLRAGRPLKATDVARTFEVSTRTVYRDLDYLRDDMRVPVAFDPRKRTYFLTEPTAALVPVTISRGEVVALFFAERVLRQYRGTPFEADFASALDKIQSLLPEDVSVSPEMLDACLSMDLGPTYASDAAVFADVLSALRTRRVALIRYRSLNSGRTLDRRIRPYHVFNHRGDWYVAAWDERRREVRDFALHRIRRIVATTDMYEIPADFNARDYLAEAFAIEKGGRPAEVAIRFSPRQARWIRDRRWHSTARVQSMLDGGCIFRLRVSGLEEVRRWVMQFGAEAEVLAPVWLRRRVAEELRVASSLYRETREPSREVPSSPRSHRKRP